MMEPEKNLLPQIVLDYIEQVVRHVKYRRKIRQDVKAELLAHFEDALRGVEDEADRQKKAEGLIQDFGDVKRLATLIRRGKKRCRPIWQKAVFTILKIVGIVLVLCIIRFGYMASGRPVMSVDYTRWMNEKVRADRDESLNAWHEYQKAIDSLSKELPSDVKKIYDYTRYQEKTPADWEAIESFLKTESKAIEMFRQGASKPYYWNKYKSPETNAKFGEFAAGVVSELMPQLSGYKKIAQRMYELQIPLEIHQGNIKQAVNDSIALYRFGRHILSQGVAIEQLVGVALEAMALGTFEDLPGQTELSADDLLRLQQVVETDYDPTVAMMDWSMEKAFWYDQIQRSFTDDGKGSGRPMPMGTILTASDYKDFIKGFVAGFPDRKEVVSRIDNWFEEFEVYRARTPYAIHRSEKNKAQEKGLIGRTPIQTAVPLMQQITAPAVQRTIQVSWRDRVSQAEVITILSVLRFQKENGRLPESLEQLLRKGYLLKMPMDPYSDKPLVYRKTEDGFTLYSVGFNFTDDGGVRGKDNNGKPTDWGQDGDFVFWPAQKEEPAEIQPSGTADKN
jgi:hypothetical protein